MPAPGTPPIHKPKREPEVRRATGIDPVTGAEVELPTWAAKASYYLRSRVTITLVATALAMFGARIGIRPEEGETEQILHHLDAIVVAVGWILALVFNIRRRWQPPVAK